MGLVSCLGRKLKRFMGDASAYAYVAMSRAIEDAGVGEDMISNDRTGLIAGSGGGSPRNQVWAADTLRNEGIRRVGPYMVPRAMSSTISACLATSFKIRGLNYTISSACASSTHCIGHSYEQIQAGRQDIIFAGGGEEMTWEAASLFDGMGALSSKYNDSPDTASRPYDATRDGFVMSGGGGIVVLEEYEHAKSRGAKIYAEIIGYAANSDGYNMVAPSGEGAVRCMRAAIEGIDAPIDYINTHGTSTPAGDLAELNAMIEVFGDDVPRYGSTKSLSGHSLGAAGVHEIIYSLLMMENNFISASANANIESLDERAANTPPVMERIDDVVLKTVLSNNFGFGGTNACLVLQKV
jgi:3-oxoacyl-[acyl-carrier-protein] synthase-1